MESFPKLFWLIVLILRELLDVNPENHTYYASLFSILGLPFKTDIEDESIRKEVLSLYDSLAQKYPRSSAPRRLPLDLLVGYSISWIFCGHRFLSFEISYS